jgi:hypothetical protein
MAALAGQRVTMFGEEMGSGSIIMAIGIDDGNFTGLK